MAGDWLKMRHDLTDDPAVIRLSVLCGLEEDAVIGKLFRLWSWADRHSDDGQVEGVDLAWVDRLARCAGYGAALVRVGWLVETGEGLSFPRFDRHCSDTAKARALGKNRSERCRNAASVTVRNGVSVTKPSLEKRREEIHHHPREAWEDFRTAWNAGKGRAWTPVTPPAGWADRMAEPGWFEVAMEAIGRIGACRYFKTPMTLIQFVKPGWAEKVLGGSFDEPKGVRTGDDKPPPKAFTGADAAAFEATRRALAAKTQEAVR